MNENLLKQYNITPHGVIHVGAHIGEELEHYINLGVKKLIYIEANPEVIPVLTNHTNKFKDKIDVKIFNYAITDQNAILQFYVTDNVMSSSLLPLKLHQKYYPTVHHQKIINVNGITFNDLMRNANININDYNILVLDIQGAELIALKKSVDYINRFDMIMTEISREEIYAGCCLHNEITEFLKQYNFYMIDYFENKNKPNDDCYYIRRK
ncbi:MAG: FkbM family methyltransferase [Candidatus Nanoarchaeia archaeon]|nr:FkbM family methyltransferase [Candidatus Nanoarchaeia archaeon]